MVGPAWMGLAARVAAGFRPTTRSDKRARHSIYCVLLHDPARPGRWGLYVGQTARDPDWRFDQHKAGYRASRAVRRFGVRVLPELLAHLNPMMEWESLDLEMALAEVFTVAGIDWVEGDH